MATKSTKSKESKETKSIVQKSESKKSTRGRYFGIVLYPDNANHMSTLNDYILNQKYQAQDGFRPIVINHKPDKEETKPHIHVQLIFNQQKTTEGVRKLMGHHPDVYQWQLFYMPDYDSEESGRGLSSVSKKNPISQRCVIYKNGLKPVVTTDAAGNKMPVTLPYSALTVTHPELQGVKVDYLPDDCYIDSASPFSLSKTGYRVSVFGRNGFTGYQPQSFDNFSDCQAYCDAENAKRANAILPSEEHLEPFDMNNDGKYWPCWFTNNNADRAVGFEDIDCPTDIFDTEAEALSMADLYNHTHAIKSFLYYGVQSFDRPTIKQNYIWQRVEFWMVNHVEKIQDPYAYAVYMIHQTRDCQLQNKTPYTIADVYGSESLKDQLYGHKKLSDDSPLRYLLEYIDRPECTNLTSVLTAALNEGNMDVCEYCQNRTYFVLQLLKDKNVKKMLENDAKIHSQEEAVDLFTAEEMSLSDPDKKAEFKDNVKDIAQQVVNDETVTKMFGLSEWLHWLVQAGQTILTANEIAEYRDSKAAELRNSGMFVNRDVLNIFDKCLEILAPSVGIEVPSRENWK